MATITGTDASDPELEGSLLADQIFGLGGDDILIGFEGDDELEGGKGADDLFGSSGFDYASYRGSAQAVYVSLGAFDAGGGDATGDRLYGIEGVIGSANGDSLLGDDQRNIIRGESGSDALLGFGGDDTVHGGAGNDWFEGGGGTDDLRGDAGNDVLDGGAGNDVLRGGAGIDTASFYGVGVSADLASGTAVGGALIDTDRLLGIENLSGTGYPDRLAGNGGANTLYGGGEADTLIGRGGADRFDFHSRYESPPDFADSILDFNRGQGDRIGLSATDANEQTNGDQAFKFIGQAEFTAPGQLRFYQQNGDTIIEANTTGVDVAEMRIVLDPLLSMQAGDFFL